MREFYRNDGFRISDQSGVKTLDQIKEDFGEGDYQIIEVGQNEVSYVEDGILKKKSSLPTAAEIRTREIIGELDSLEKKVIRPILDGEQTKIDEINSQRLALRTELQSL